MLINEEKSGQGSGENVWLWTLKLITGLGIVVIIGIHLVVNHFVSSTGLLQHADVLEYYSNPLIVLMEAIFLTFVVSHSLIGTRSIILDLKPSRVWVRILDAGFIILGSGSIVYGLWLLRAVVAQI